MNYHYKAFISYKHDPVDSAVAAEIQTRLERFHIPYALQKEKSIKTLRPVFRDKEELSATENLNDTIKNALLETEYLIVICSTRSIRSIWVQKEIGFFLEHHEKSKVLTVLVDGEPSEVIPRVLLEEEVSTVDEYGNVRTQIVPLEPLSCDYRMDRRRARREEFPRLAAALIGCRYNDLRQRQRQYRMRLMGAGLAALTMLMLYFVWSNIQISKNLKQSQISQSRNLANMSTASLDGNDRIEAVGYALEALPVEEDKPVIYEAVNALSRAVGAYNFPDTMDIENIARMPARYEGYALKVDKSGRFAVLQDGKHLLRFWDLESKEDIGEAGSDETISLLSVMDGNVLLAGSGSRLSAYDMETSKELWSQTYEQKILGIRVLEDSDAAANAIALVFEDHVLTVSAQTREILGSYDSGMEQTPFCYAPEHPYVYARYNYNEDQDGGSLYFDKEEQKLYVMSRRETQGSVNGILVLDAGTMTADFHPVQVECGSQYAMMADESGIYMICRGQYDDSLNSVVSTVSRRTKWLYQREQQLLVLKLDPEGNALWETTVSYTGTGMLGRTELIRIPGNAPDGTAGNGGVAAVFSNCVVALDRDNGSILNTYTTQDEITDLRVHTDTALLASTVEGNYSNILLQSSTIGSYMLFKKEPLRMEVRRPEIYGKNVIYLLYGDGIRVYAVKEGDEEFTAYTGEQVSSTVADCCLDGRKYCICSAGGKELVRLDLAQNLSDLKSFEDLGLTLAKDMMYMDPEEEYIIVYGSDDSGSVFQKIFLEDLTHETISGPGMGGNVKEYNYAAEPVCAGNKILYFAIKAGYGVRNPLCLCVYNIPSGSWAIREIDAGLLNVMLRPVVTRDGLTAVLADQWDNGYFISTEDGAVTPMSDKIPAWTFSAWNEKGTAFAVRIEGAEKEQIASFSADGAEIFRIGRDYVAPISMTYHDKSLWVLYEDREVCEYDEKTGTLLKSMSAAVQSGTSDENISWDFTEDGQLILGMGSVMAQMDLGLGGMIAQVPEGVGYIRSLDRMLVINEGQEKGDDRVFVSYPRYTVDDFIRKGKEIAENTRKAE